METIATLPTPALLVRETAFAHNLATMSELLPGPRLRPHIKAFKSTAVAQRLHDAGHTNFCCATIREIEGMAAVGLGTDLLLANEVLDARRLGAVVEAGARVTVAVDSEATIDAAATGGVREVLVDVNVGLPRCGCRPDQAGRLADLARATGLTVRGVMGYEGHLMAMPDRAQQAEEVERSMVKLLAAHADVGGDIVSAGGTGTYDINTWANEIQAGSYLFMDTHYAGVGLPFQQALTVLSEIISVDGKGRWAVGNAGLKSLGMDHGDPSVEGGAVAFCSDEHITLTSGDPDVGVTWSVGDRVELLVAHVDPTIAMHEMMHVIDDDGAVIEQWPVDLRGW